MSNMIPKDVPKRSIQDDANLQLPQVSQNLLGNKDKKAEKQRGPNMHNHTPEKTVREVVINRMHVDIMHMMCVDVYWITYTRAVVRVNIALSTASDHHGQ